MAVRSRRPRLLALLATVALLAACGDDDVRGTAGDGDQPPGRLAGGEATVEVSGDLDAELRLALRPDSVYSAPPGGMSLSYDDDAGSFLGIGGETAAGTRPTSLQLSLTITVEGEALFVSEGGECTVDIDRADATGVGGSFQCTDLANETASIDAAGAFAASA